MPRDKNVLLKIIFLVVGTQKNHLNEHPKHMFKLIDKEK